jgi:hypothetical protein
MSFYRSINFKINNLRLTIPVCLTVFLTCYTPFMDDDDRGSYRAALLSAREAFDKGVERLREIGLEQYRLNHEQVLLRRTITALAAMCSESPWTDPMGITDSCAAIMEVEPDELTTQDVMKRLGDIGFDLASQKNPAASVHSVLSRLATRGQISKVTREDDEVAWRGPKYKGHEEFAGTEITEDDIPF